MSALAFSGSASSGGAKLLIASTAMLLLLLLYTILLADNITAVMAIGYLACLLGIFLGWSKLAEPKYSLLCDAEGVRYQHRCGSWFLPWSAFSYCAMVNIDGRTLTYIGFKVTDMDALLQQIPVRLAVKIINEQRPLYFEAIRQSCRNGQCATELLREKDQFKTSKAVYDGVKAAFAQRMLRLSEATGLDLMVPVNVSLEQAESWCKAINKHRLVQLQALN
jgi:hypothetical protein